MLLAVWLCCCYLCPPCRHCASSHQQNASNPLVWAVSALSVPMVSSLDPLWNTERAPSTSTRSRDLVAQIGRSLLLGGICAIWSLVCIEVPFYHCDLIIDLAVILLKKIHPVVAYIRDSDLQSSDLAAGQAQHSVLGAMIVEKNLSHLGTALGIFSCSSHRCPGNSDGSAMQYACHDRTVQPRMTQFTCALSFDCPNECHATQQKGSHWLRLICHHQQHRSFLHAAIGSMPNIGIRQMTLLRLHVEWA